MISKNLFVCCTPLQCHIARIIIKIRKLNKDDCDLIFYNSAKNESLIYNYNKYKIDYNLSCYYHVQNNFPFNVYKLKNILFRRIYNNVFIASIDSIYIHYILSNIIFENLFTFDDGTANISENGHYGLNKIPLFKSIIYKLLFFKIVERDNLNRQSIAHYTIFKYYKNYIGNYYIYLDLNKEAEILKSSITYNNINKKKYCRILLGTVENEALTKINNILIIEKYKKLKNLHNSEIFYIKHPRGEINHIDCNIPLLSNESFSVAEFIILEALKKYDQISIYGFSSTVQLNLLSNKNIDIVLFESRYESELIKDVRNKIKNCSNVKIINFDLI